MRSECGGILSIIVYICLTMQFSVMASSYLMQDTPWLATYHTYENVSNLDNLSLPIMLRVEDDTVQDEEMRHVLNPAIGLFYAIYTTSAGVRITQVLEEVNEIICLSENECVESTAYRADINLATLE